MGSNQTQINLSRMADQMNVVLTQIFRDYVAKGSPTKRGGLRFLDVSSSKTFAFEKSIVSDDATGNLLVLSAPYIGKEEDIRHILIDGPHGKEIQHLTVRASTDIGKADRLFVEIGYYVPTLEWMSDENVIDFAKEHRCVSTHDAVIGILETRLLPMASEIMEFLINKLREN